MESGSVEKATQTQIANIEKSTGKKTMYRVKIISKDKQVYYSSSVVAG